MTVARTSCARNICLLLWGSSDLGGSGASQLFQLPVHCTSVPPIFEEVHHHRSNQWIFLLCAISRYMQNPYSSSRKNYLLQLLAYPNRHLTEERSAICLWHLALLTDRMQVQLPAAVISSDPILPLLVRPRLLKSLE